MLVWEGGITLVGQNTAQCTVEMGDASTESDFVRISVIKAGHSTNVRKTLPPITTLALANTMSCQKERTQESLVL